MAFIILTHFSSTPSFLSAFYHEEVLNFANIFSKSVGIITWFSPSFFECRYYIGQFCVFSYPCIPEINHTWPLYTYTILLTCFWIPFASLLLQTCVHQYLSGILVCIFIGMSLSGSGIQYSWSPRMSFKVFFPVQVFRGV